MDTPASPPCPDERQLEYPIFSPGQLLTNEDLTALESYLTDKRRSHNRLLHGSGTVCGLAVAPTDPPSERVIVQPGVAIDCCGREIVLVEPIEVDPRALVGDPPPVGRVYVTLEYGELEVRAMPAPGGGDPVYTRIREVPQVGASTTPPPAATRPEAGRPCPPCPDPTVTIAALDLSKLGPITGAHIDNDARQALRGNHAARV
jgi:hypothetical protein